MIRLEFMLVLHVVRHMVKNMDKDAETLDVEYKALYIISNEHQPNSNSSSNKFPLTYYTDDDVHKIHTIQFCGYIIRVLFDFFGDYITSVNCF